MDYWQRFTSTRVSRRRALLAASGLAGAAAILAACGGSDSGGSSGGASNATRDASGLVVKATDETKGAKRGGTYKNRGSFEPSTLDPHTFPNNFYVYQTYGTLFQVKDGIIDYSNGDVDGDLIESWEVSPDKL